MHSFSIASKYYATPAQASDSPGGVPKPGLLSAVVGSVFVGTAFFIVVFVIVMIVLVLYITVGRRGMFSAKGIESIHGWDSSSFHSQEIPAACFFCIYVCVCVCV